MSFFRLIPAALAAALLVLPASAVASGWSVRALPVAPQPGHGLLDTGGWTTSPPLAVRGGFRALGLTWRGARGAAFEVRTARAGSPFGDWVELERNEAPDSAEGASTAYASEPLWVGRAARVQVRSRGAVRALRAVVIDPGPSPAAARRPQAVPKDTGGVPQPAIVTRAQWGADDSIVGTPRYAPAVRYAVVHHTAGSNDYSQADAPAVVRAIYLYHARTLGWSDIGYQFLVDRFGTIYEGRAGGMTRAVVGAHVYGFNTGSTAVSLIGNYDTAQPSPEALDAVARLLAWRLDVAHLDPLARVSVVSGGGDKYAEGATVDQPLIAGHSDYGRTACPGVNVYAQLDAMRAAVAAVPGLKIWDPRPAPVDPAFADGPVRVTARLSAAAPWRVSILDAAGVVLAEGRGTGIAVDYTWPGATAGMPVADLTYRIEAGSGSGATLAREATGRLDGRDVDATEENPAQPLADVKVTPRIFTPNGDGTSDVLRLSWLQGVTAWVTAYVDTAAGAMLVPIDYGRSAGPGTQEVRWAGTDAAGAPLPSGRYTVRLVLEPPGSAPVVQTAAVDLRRGVGAFAATRYISPNGDGRGDRALIAFDRMEPGPVRLRVLEGSLPVATLIDVPSVAGSQSLAWDGSGLPDGLYRVVLDAPGPAGTLVLGAKVTIDRRAPTARVVSVKRRARRVLRVELRFSEHVTWNLASRGRLLRKGERPGSIRIDLPRSRVGRTLRLYLRDRAGNAARPMTIRVP